MMKMKKLDGDREEINIFRYPPNLPPPTLPKKVVNDKSKINYIVQVFLVITLVFLVFILSISQTSAIGITPGRTTVNFEPGLQREVSFSVVNSEHKDMGVVFMVRGELAEYVTLKQTYTSFSTSEESKSFTYSVNLPQKFEKPGLYEAEIVALEMPKNLEEQGTFVGATVGVATQLHVYVPYPNKYVEAEVNVMSSGDKINFIIPVTSRGKLDIVNLKAVIDIYTSLNEKVATIETNSISLNSLERKELFAEWTPSVNPGKYMAVVTLLYDNEAVKLEKEFNVGEMMLEIKDIVVRDFQLGEIAKFNALVENKWSDDLKEVYLNILVYNAEGEIMADFKSPTYDIDALAQSEMVAYWDTGGVHQGSYDGKVLLKYGEKSTERNIQLKITDSSIEISGLTGRVVVRGSGGLNTTTLLLILVIVLVIANVIWFVVVKKFLKRKK